MTKTQENAIVNHLRSGGEVGFEPGDVHTQSVFFHRMSSREVFESGLDLDPTGEWFAESEVKATGTAWADAGPAPVRTLGEVLQILDGQDPIRYE